MFKGESLFVDTFVALYRHDWYLRSVLVNLNQNSSEKSGLILFVAEGPTAAKTLFIKVSTCNTGC